MTGTEQNTFEKLEHVRVEPPMIQASAIGSFDGRCAVAYHGAAGRCTGEPAFKTTIDWQGEFQYIALCPNHAERNGHETAAETNEDDTHE